MYEIEMNEISEAFFPCWKAAGIHLSKQVDGGIQSWLRAHPYPPFLEHLSFRLGNQLFFVRVDDVDGMVAGWRTCRDGACWTQRPKNQSTQSHWSLTRRSKCRHGRSTTWPSKWSATTWRSKALS